MCKIVDDYANEIADKRDVDNIKKLFNNGCSLEMVIASFTNLSEDIIKSIYDEVVGNKTLA